MMTGGPVENRLTEGPPAPVASEGKVTALDMARNCGHISMAGRRALGLISTRKSGISWQFFFCPGVDRYRVVPVRPEGGDRA